MIALLSQDAEEQLPEERLIFCDSIYEIATAAALQQCQKAVEASGVCCFAMLMKEGQHYLSTLRPLSKSQTTSMHKQVGEPPKLYAMFTLHRQWHIKAHQFLVAHAGSSINGVDD